MKKTTPEHLALVKSLFKGREDVFAIRWEKGSKRGYMPAYFFDPYRYRAHKMQGGSFHDFSEKSFLSLTDEQIGKHLTGEHFVGIYPLLQDNTSWFIAADFDEGDWVLSARKLIHSCIENGIPAYLERSRSGNGGHVWIFFDQPIPAYKSRKIISSLLILSGATSAFDKNMSFDRLFPNQDSHSGKGLGNLIALPLNGLSVQKGNTCFIDPETLTAYPDQLSFIGQIKRASIVRLEKLYSGLAENVFTEQSTDKLQIVLKNNIRLNKNAIHPLLFTYIKEELNFPNTAFFSKKGSGKSTYGTDRFFRLIEEEGDAVYLPKGFAGKLIRFCKLNQLDFYFSDERLLQPPVLYSFQGLLRPYQEESMQLISKKDLGVIVAPPGSGKTVLALKIVADKQQPTLIIVHRKQLALQWVERIESFLGIARKDIGKIGQGKATIGKQITVATIQSLSKADIHNFQNAFGLIIVDECHHVPAKTFRSTIGEFNSRYLYGLTATPFRKYSDGKIIFTHLGEVITEISIGDLSKSALPEIIIRNTGFEVPFNGKTDKFETLSRILIHDSSRNRVILEDVVFELNKGRKCVIITERKEHVDTLELYLKQSFETIILHGGDSENVRDQKWSQLRTGNYEVLITTGQFFGEGSDLPNGECLFLVYPFAFVGKLIQYVGRVQRSEVSPTVYDYRDEKVDYLNRMFLKRNVYYRKLEKQYTLFDFPDEQEKDDQTADKQETFIEKTVKIKIADLDFLYGSVQFECTIAEYPVPIKFDIEQQNIRPEFEVLKPYFEKFLKSKIIVIDVTVVVDNQNQIIALTAVSSDLEKLTREAVESVRFRFMERGFLRDRSSLDLGKSGNTIMQTAHMPYETGEELLSDVLSKGSFRHQRELQYLAERHQGRILKIRFMLQPFAFIFLIEGIDNQHLVMETVDTEEATYLWRMPKNINELKLEIQKIDSQLNTIRNEGRQKFLESNPIDFSKVQHDYMDSKKGFIVWKEHLEERLF
ncbi:TOTE conflict system archaeo-eukaryotic primase domain-containing protein [Algoriphagus sp.]|uniref:TOTE conflict system archaeo-eukaryotic primase domain-containing protein n=1 Tax=Algoriphagus sp. TaxID=1872435 RepID=UPI003F6F3F57